MERCRVLVVALSRGPSAPRVTARSLAGPHQVAQLPRRPVGADLPAVATSAGFQPLDPGPGQPCGQAGQAAGRPRAGPGTGVAESAPGLVGDREVPAGGLAAGEAAGQVPA